MTLNKTHRDWARTAATLAEALPHIQAYDGRQVVIKLGGAAMADAQMLDHFALDVALLRQCGVRPVVVHGGGPQIDRMLDRLGIPSAFANGQRRTSAEAVEVVEMVLAGTVNKQVVSAIHAHGGQAIGISGKDGGLIRAEKRKSEAGVDLGFVGTPAEIRDSVLHRMLYSGFIPVVAPVAWGADGASYNVNADTAAGAIAVAIRADRLLLLTDVDGVMGPDGALISRISPAEAESLIDDGTIGVGMIPKVQTAVDAVANGVGGAVILNGRMPHAALLELFTDSGAGTLVVGDSDRSGALGF